MEIEMSLDEAVRELRDYASGKTTRPVRTAARIVLARLDGVEERVGRVRGGWLAGVSYSPAEVADFILGETDVPST